MKTAPRVLILTLFSGENEFAACRHSLETQTYKRWDHKVFEHLPNFEAHQALYTEIAMQKNNYDLFVKVDADMVLSRATILEEIVDIFRTHPAADQINFAVHDVLSNSRIMGILTYTQRATWAAGSPETLFVDETPTIPGKRLLIWSRPAPIALHNPDPSPFQAFHFGAHRMLKAVQRGRRERRTIQSVIQWHLVGRVWNEFQRNGDANRAAMLLGAYSVWRGQLDRGASNYFDASLKRVFKAYAEAGITESARRLLTTKWALTVRLNQFQFALFAPQILGHRLYSRVHERRYRVTSQHPA